MIRIPHQKSGRAFNYLRFAYHFGKSFPKFFGTEKKTCPLCDNEGRFLAFGQPPRYDVICPSCGGFDRHRQMKLWIDGHSDYIAGRKVVHFAPEEFVGKELRKHASEYLGADLMAGKADLQLNLEDIALPDESVGVIVALMVLEHVDDSKALPEIYRVLEAGGCALLMVPVIEGWDRTLEPEDLPGPVRTNHDRFRWFGQHDHVRYYGADVRQRIVAAGFDLEEYVAREPDVSRYALVRGERLFVARKG